MKNKTLIERLKMFPMDADVFCYWEDFAKSMFQDVDFDEKKNEVCFCHNNTFQENAKWMEGGAK